ncbi:hypothetical protein HOLleu_35828 [Holothuria leucospilota]|uniref:Uncharacterized protein n=1 Tax=Holothuria leucospilota TaxID=206669 RepID=A0A9Q0YIY8_HOLLE|nr:hypothetical protein HOLleu_35828 [Holothuria leucospilota]
MEQTYNMNSPTQQIFLENQQHPPAAPGLFVNPTRTDGKLWGSNVRRSMGITQIICGGIEFVLGIAVICVNTYFFDFLDYVGWGIWTGVLAIVAGFLGVFSLKKRGMVIAYMVTSIITAVLCGGGFVLAAFGTLYSSVNYTPQPLHQQYRPTPPYTVVASQSGITSQTTSPGTKVSPKM